MIGAAPLSHRLDGPADALPSIVAPTLVICGEFDAGATPQQARYLADRIPDATLASLAAAQVSNVEAAGHFNHVVAEFLQP